MAFRNFAKTRDGESFWDAIRHSKDPPAFIVLLEDSAALIGILIAAAGIAAATHFAMPILDGVASICIGVLLGVTAIILARESKSLLIGEAASPEINRAIRQIAESDPAVKSVTSLLTVHLAPDEIVAMLGLDFSDLRTAQIEDAVGRIQTRIKAETPSVVATFIRPPAQRAEAEPLSVAEG